MDVLARAGLVDLDQDVYAHPRRSPNLSSWPVPTPLFLRRSPIPVPPESSTYSPMTSKPTPMPANLINNVLPPELLLAIFQLLTYDISDHGANWHYSSSWLSITHVCHSWRTLALNSPLLWSRISFARAGDIASTMLARSGDAPLDTAYGDRLARMPPLSLYTALTHLHRTSYLRLNVTRALLAHLAPRLPSHAPLLRRIHVDLVDGMYAPGAGHALPGLAGLEAPELRVLILDGIPLSPSASLLVRSSLLTELVLSGIPRPARWGVGDMLSVLKGLPLLKRLVLVHAMEEDYDDDPPGPEVTLAQLEQLTVHAPTPAVSLLVSSLTAGSGTQYTLSCAAREDRDTDLSSAIPRSLRSNGALKRLDVAFQLTEFAIRLYTDPDGPVALELLLEPERVLNGRRSSGRASLSELTRNTSIDFSGIRSLNVMNDGAISCDDMHGMYRALGRRIEVPLEEFGCHVRDMDYLAGDGRGDVGIGRFLGGARRIRVKIGSWLPDDDIFGRTGRDWAAGCIRRWAFGHPTLSPLGEEEEGVMLEEVVLDEKERFSGAELRCLLGLDPPGPGTDGGDGDPPWIVERRTPIVEQRGAPVLGS